MARTKKERKHDTSVDETIENGAATQSDIEESEEHASPTLENSSSEEHNSPKATRRNPRRKTTQHLKDDTDNDSDSDADSKKDKVDAPSFVQRAKSGITNAAASVYQFFPSIISVGLAASVGAGLFTLGISSAALGLSTTAAALSAAAAAFVVSEAARGLRSITANYLLNRQKPEGEEDKKEEIKTKGRKRQPKETPEQKAKNDAEKAHKEVLDSYLDAGKQADAWGPWLKHGVTHPKSWLPLVTKAGNVYQIGRATAAAERAAAVQPPKETPVSEDTPKKTKKNCCKK